MRRLLLSLGLLLLVPSLAVAQTGTGGAASGGSVTQGTTPWVVGSSDATTASTALGALNDAIAVVLAGNVGAAFQLAASGTGIYTVTAECSFDGGANYPRAVPLTDTSTGLDGATQAITSGQAISPYTAVCPFAASHIRVRVSAYTSGTATWTARAAIGGFPSSVPTLLTAAPTVSAANTAATVTLTGATGQRVCVTSIVIFVTAATSTTTTLTVSDGATIVLDLGIPQLTTLSVPVSYSGTPILCGSTGNNVVVNIGAGGTSVVTHTSVVADRG